MGILGKGLSLVARVQIAWATSVRFYPSFSGFAACFAQREQASNRQCIHAQTRKTFTPE